MEQMTAEQAIQELQDYIESDNYDYVPSNGACKLAVDALEKQVPKKPFYNGFDFECPFCNTVIEAKRSKENPMYCDICGQVLDWTEYHRKDYQ